MAADDDQAQPGQTRRIDREKENTTRPDAPHSIYQTPGDTDPERERLAPRKPDPVAKRGPLELRPVPRDNYIIRHEFARGGLGRILEAHDQRLDRTVAIKELHFKHPAAEARFLREVGVTARLQHPNIIPVHEAGTWPEGESFFAMKLVKGKSLAQEIFARTSFVDRLTLVQAVVDTAEAMAYAHSQNIIHRDLKPANVLIGPFGETVVIDWGLAKDLSLDTDDDEISAIPTRKPDPNGIYQTTDGAVIGTPAYMPPEQARGESVDATADVYALGALLYHVLAGQLPYADESHSEGMLNLVLAGPPAPLHLLAEEAPPDLLAIVERAMARDPKDRYPTAREMAEELKAYITGRLVGAYHYSLWEILRRFIARQKAAFATGTFAAVALIVFGVISVRSITEERDRARASRAVAERNLAEIMLETDPTAAVLKLKEIDPLTPRAVTIAVCAEEAGVAQRILGKHRDQVETIDFSPDSALLASGSRDGQITLWDATGVRELTGHGDRVTAVTFSPDGTLLASSGYDGNVRLWDIETAQAVLLAQPKAQAGNLDVSIKDVAFSPDGALLAGLGFDGRLRLWQLPAGNLTVRDAPVSREERDLFVRFSPDGKWLVSGSHGDTLRLWSVNNLIDRELVAHQGPIRDAVFSPDWLASAGADGTVRLWSLTGPDPFNNTATLIGHTGPVNAVAFAPDHARLASAGADGRVRIWRVDDASLEATLHGDSEEILTVAFSPDGAYLASAGWDTHVVVHRLADDTFKVLRGHTSRVSALRFSSDGKQLASASWDKQVRIWNVGAVTHPQRRILGNHPEGVKTVAFSPDGRFVASAGHDNKVRLWDISTGEGRTLTRHNDHVFRVLFSPDGARVASASDDRTVHVVDLKDGTERILRGHEADVEELAFAPDGTQLASAAEDRTVRLWDPATGKVIATLEAPKRSPLAYSPDGALLATAGVDNSVRLWNWRSGEPRVDLRGHTGVVRAIAFTTDGSLLATAAADDSVRLWRMPAGTNVGTLSSLDGAQRLAFSPDGKLIAVAGLGSRLWICAVTPRICRELVGHDAQVSDLVFSHDGRWLVTAGEDNLLMIWDPQSGEHRQLTGHTRPIFDVDLAPNDALVVSGSADGTVRLWPLVPIPAAADLRSYLDRLSAGIIR